MDFSSKPTTENIANKVLQRHYNRGFWLLVVLVMFLGMMGKLESGSEKPIHPPTVERIPASEID